MEGPPFRRRAWRKVRVYPRGRKRYPKLENLSLVRARGNGVKSQEEEEEEEKVGKREERCLVLNGEITYSFEP